MGLRKHELSAGWEAKVYEWFSEHGLDEYTENRDDRGGWARREAIEQALAKLGLPAAYLTRTSRGTRWVGDEPDRPSDPDDANVSGLNDQPEGTKK
jgi:hypothetical protein